MDRKIRKKQDSTFAESGFFCPSTVKMKNSLFGICETTWKNISTPIPPAAGKTFAMNLKRLYEAVYGYLSAFPAEDLCRSIRSRKRIRVVLIIVLILSALIFTLKTYQYYLMCEDSKDNIVVYYQEVIE